MTAILLPISIKIVICRLSAYLTLRRLLLSLESKLQLMRKSILDDCAYNEAGKSESENTRPTPTTCHSENSREYCMLVHSVRNLAVDYRMSEIAPQHAVSASMDIQFNAEMSYAVSCSDSR